MDPQTLPAEALAIYKKIKKDYKVNFEPLILGELRLNLLKITDLEPLLDGKDPLENPAEFPYWVKLWESALVLAEFLASQQYQKGCTLLDLGAGIGAPGLAAAACGCKTTLSDYDKLILDFQKVSAAASGLDNVNFEILDWLDPPEMEKFDIIIGAEIIFREDFFKPLLRVMGQALKPEGVIYLAHDIKRQSLAPFLHLAEADYAISASRKKLKSLEGDKIIMLNRLVPRHKG